MRGKARLTLAQPPVVSSRRHHLLDASYRKRPSAGKRACRGRIWAGRLRKTRHSQGALLGARAHVQTGTSGAQAVTRVTTAWRRKTTTKRSQRRSQTCPSLSDSSFARSTRLEGEVRCTPDKAEAQRVADALVTENIKKGWGKVLPAKDGTDGQP